MEVERHKRNFYEGAGKVVSVEDLPKGDYRVRLVNNQGGEMSWVVSRDKIEMSVREHAPDLADCYIPDVLLIKGVA